MKGREISKRILVGITGRGPYQLIKKIEEAEKLKISQAALFLEFLDRKQREKVYRALLLSKIKRLPIVHIRNDIRKNELAFLYKNYGTRYFTIHENAFKFLKNWRKFYKNLFLEMNYDNFISNSVKIRKIGGFCVDLAHFKTAEEKWTKEFKYISKRQDFSGYFACNHLSGYTYKRRKDLHTVGDKKDFNYLRTLPKFLFGKWIAIEIFNSIAEQLKFKSYFSKLLSCGSVSPLP